MATIKADKTKVVRTALYPIDMPLLNIVGYQAPTAPGSKSTGELDNADMDDVYPKVIDMYATDKDNFSVRFLREPGVSSINLTVGDYNFVVEDAGDGITFDTTNTGPITGIYNYLQTNEKNMITVVFNFG
jgi:hypothetical protein